MSAAFVPGLIRRVDPSSHSRETPKSFSLALPKPSLTVGDCGPIWTSVKGGGLGNRGELEGEAPVAAIGSSQGVGIGGPDPGESAGEKKGK